MNPWRSIRPRARCVLRGLMWIAAALVVATGGRARDDGAGMTTTSVGQKVAVLAYHEIADAKDALDPGYAVSPTMFVRQLDWLRVHGFQFVSVEDLLADASGQRPLPAKAVLLTFDDGYRSVYDHAWPVLEAWRIPALISIVGAWTEGDGPVDLDGRSIPRSQMMTWEELRALRATGLVELGSHSFDLHRGIEGDPQGNLQPAATTRHWLAADRRYEAEHDYRARVERDLVRSRDLIRKRTGRAPRVIAWPYGSYNETLRKLAIDHGMTIGLTLDDEGNRADTPLSSLRRVLVEGDMQLADFARALAWRDRPDAELERPQKIVHVDLDNIYDPDPAQQERNLGLLLERLEWLNANTVYLQAFADPDGDGSADAVYFPNRHLPMRADLFDRAVWQIQTRTPVRNVYAWMPMLAWRLPPSHPAAKDVVISVGRSGKDHLQMGYHRLSPFSPRAREVIRDIFADLARSARFNGLLFHDDVTLSDFEDGSAPALATYRKWDLPGSVAEIRAHDDLLGRFTILKIHALDDFAAELAAIVRAEQPGLRTARNLYARVVQDPRSEVWYAQALDNSLASYDFTAIMAMPYMENAEDPDAFYRQLVDAVKARPDAMRKVVFEIQTVDWRQGNRRIPSEQIEATIRELYDLGVVHVGYYPDQLFEDHPNPTRIRAAFGAKHPALDAP